jgi:glutamine synthetase
MIEMIEQHVIPSIKAAGVGPLAEVQAGVKTLKAAFEQFHHTGNTYN